MSEYCRRNSENSCISQPCSWLLPSLKEVEFTKLSNIDFCDPRKRSSKNKVNAPKQALRKILPHEDEKQKFYTKLHQTGMDSAILRFTPGFVKDLFHQLQKSERLCLIFIIKRSSNFSITR